MKDRLQECNGGFCSAGNLSKQSGLEWMDDGGKFTKLKNNNNGNKVSNKEN